MKTSEHFALSQWLTHYPDDATYEEVLKALRDERNTWVAEDIDVWEVVENHPLDQVADFIEDTRKHFEQFTSDAKKIDLKKIVIELLGDYHANEIGRLIGMSESEGKKIVRDIYLNEWGYTEWIPHDVGDGCALFCHGAEWIDENGDHVIFETEEEAINHLKEFLHETK
jgi:hypothetical protein